MKNSEIVRLLESSNSRLFKEEKILKQMESGNDIFFEGMRLAYNKLLTFGVKKVPESKIDGDGLEWHEFYNISKRLINRTLTGHAARDEIEKLMLKSNSDEWNFFFKRILQKDMRCGLSEKTINNVAKKNNFEKYLIPVFSCQLAQDCEQHKKKLVGDKILEVKLDGVRVLSILYPNGKVDMFSRNGKELNNFKTIQKVLGNSLEHYPIKEAMVLDGEIVSKNFQDLMKQIHRKQSIQNPDASLYLFDIISLENFKLGIEKITYKKRMAKLKDWHQKCFTVLENVHIIEQLRVNLNTNPGLEEFKEFNKKSLINGYEGIMIKDPESFYECKRSTSWLKSKPFIEISLEAKKIEEGTGKNSGKLGAILAEGEDGGKFFKLSVGSGFTDKQREEFWQFKEKLIGKIIEVRADSISKSQDGEYWSLRFPRFKCFRGFEINEKL